MTEHQPVRVGNPNVTAQHDTTTATLACLICAGCKHHVIFTESGTDIMQCRTCGHVFSSFPADPHYDGYWGDEVPADDHFYWRHARARMHNDFITRFVVGRSGRLLDMGCGLGFFLTVLKSYPGWDGHGCEISGAAVRYAREILGLPNIMHARLAEADWPPRSFDLITMWDVLDHLPCPDPVLRRCHELLRDDGILFIRTPNVSTQLLRARLKVYTVGSRPDVSYLKARDHPHTYSTATVCRLMERNGFSQVEFLHLHPITGHRNAFLQHIKNLAFETVRALAVVSGGRLNFDNLFVVARK
jgi:SAM-dependent methyltransferase